MMKNSNDTIGDRTRDLPVIAQYLNQLRYRVPLYMETTAVYTEGHTQNVITLCEQTCEILNFKAAGT